MNDAAEASSSSAAVGANSSTGHGNEPAPTAAELAERQKNTRALFNKKRGTLLAHIVRDVDTLIYAELSAIYYMDCSFLRFGLRAFVQFLYLTPKQPPFPEHPPERPMLGPILGANLICLLCHLLLTPPEAGEQTRGYLHGGLAMDFIGQAGPSSRIHLFLLDIVVIFLQLTHMSAYMLQRRLKDAASGTVASSTPAVETVQPAPPSAQDLDAEERGVRRSTEQHDIEMQDLNPSGTTNSSGAPSTDAPSQSNDERASLLAPTSAPAMATPQIVDDALYSGQIVVANLDIKERIKDQIHLMKNYRTDAQASSSGVTRLRMELAQRVLRMRIGADALRESI